MKKVVIIYGYTSLGSKIADVLKEKGHKIIIVTFMQKEIEFAQKLGYVVQNSNLLNDNDLMQIGVGGEKSQVDSLFCVSESNRNNLFVTLSARNLDKKLKIISVSKSKAEAKKLMIAGASKVLNPNELGALRIYRYLKQPLMLKVLDEILFSESDLNISQIYITKDSELNGIYFKELTIHKKFNIILLGIMDRELGDKFIFNTKGLNHKIDEGDILVVLGKNLDLQEFNVYVKGIEHDTV